MSIRKDVASLVKSVCHATTRFADGLSYVADGAAVHAQGFAANAQLASGANRVYTVSDIQKDLRKAVAKGNIDPVATIDFIQADELMDAKTKQMLSNVIYTAALTYGKWPQPQPQAQAQVQPQQPQAVEDVPPFVPDNKPARKGKLAIKK